MLGILLGLGLLNPSSATAAIRQLEEAPGQMVYQSRQSLRDQRGNTWQVIVFKRIRPNGLASFDLRLVGFPGVAEIDRSHPLILTSASGNSLTAGSDDRNLFTEGTKPEPTVGQYDLKPLLSKLQAENPLKLSLPTTNGEAVHLLIPVSVIQEWQTIANYN